MSYYSGRMIGLGSDPLDGLGSNDLTGGQASVVGARVIDTTVAAPVVAKGAGVGLFPVERRDKLVEAANTAGGLAFLARDAARRAGDTASAAKEDADGKALHLLRDSLRRAVVSNGNVSGQVVKNLLDMTVTSAKRAQRLDEALLVQWPGATVASISRDLVSGSTPITKITAANVSGWRQGPVTVGSKTTLKQPATTKQPGIDTKTPTPPTTTNTELVTQALPGTEAPVATSDLVPDTSGSGGQALPAVAPATPAAGFPWMWVGIGGAVVVGGGAWYLLRPEHKKSTTANRARKHGRIKKRTSRRAT